MAKKTVADFREMKKRGEPIAWTTCYDFSMAQLAERAGLDMLLVGDSAARCVFGYSSVHGVSMDEMLSITGAVRRGAPNTFVVGDLPFLSYATPETALANAATFYRKAGVDAVILEGGKLIAPQLAIIANNGMRVIGHLGMTPLSTARLETAEDALTLIDDALALEQAGAFALLIGFCPGEVAIALHERLTIPLLGGGCGPDTDGELQPVTDILGTYPLMPAAVAARYADLGAEMQKALQSFVHDLKSRRFPGDKVMHMAPSEAKRLKALLEERG